METLNVFDRLLLDHVARRRKQRLVSGFVLILATPLLVVLFLAFTAPPLPMLIVVDANGKEDVSTELIRWDSGLVSMSDTGYREHLGPVTIQSGTNTIEVVRLWDDVWRTVGPGHQERQYAKHRSLGIVRRGRQRKLGLGYYRLRFLDPPTEEGRVLLSHDIEVIATDKE